MDTARGLSYEEFLHDYDGPRAEWKEGQAVPMVACNYPHQNLVSFLTALLRFGADARWGGILLTAPFQMKTGDDLPGREPDILYVGPQRHEQFKRLFLDGPADLAIEVVSPDSRIRDRGEKYAEYEMGGVQEYWLLDPDAQRADFFWLDAEGRYQRQPTPGDVYSSRVLVGLQMPLDWFWNIPPVHTCVRELGWM